MDVKELRIGNLIVHINENGIFTFRVKEITGRGIIVEYNKEEYTLKFSEIEPIPLTEKWLLKLGFSYINDKRCINKRWLMQVSDGYLKNDQLIDKDGTWFDGTGLYSFKKEGKMEVSTLTRGNYVCKNVTTVHKLQNLYFALTGKELTIKRGK